MNRKRMRILRIVAVASLLLTMLPGLPQAAPLYFSGGTVWDNATLNWGANPGGPYDSSWSDGSDATFEGTAGSVSVDSAVAPASTTFTVGGYTLVGANPITIGGPGAINVTAATGATTINNDLTLSADTTLTNASSGTLTIGGIITGGSNDIHKTGPGTVGWGNFDHVLASDGQIYVDQGKLRLTHNVQGELDATYGIFTPGSPHTYNVASGATLEGVNAYSIGSADTIILNGGTLLGHNGYHTFSHLLMNAPSTVDGNSGYRTSYGNDDWTVAVSGSGSTMSTGPSGTIKLNGTSARLLTISVADGANPGFDLQINGKVRDYNSSAHQRVEITGGGIVSTTGANTYSGSTTVTGGATLLVNGSHTTTGVTGDISNYVIEDTGILGGKGTISLATGKSITVQSGGALSPGDPLTAAGLGTLTINAPLTLEAGAGAIFDLGVVGSSDLVSMTTSLLTLTGQEFSDFTFNRVAGFGVGTYTLFDADSISGSLGSETSGLIGPYTGTLSTSGDGRMLLAVKVPEPSTLILFAFGLLGLLAYARRKRK